MADLSSLFGAAQPARGRRDYFGLAAPHAARFKRQIVMREAMSQDLAPEDGEQFFKFVGRRLFELGDMQGAMAVNAQAEQYGAAQAAAQQQAFENQQALARGDREQQRIDLSADAGRRAEAQLDINALNQQVNRDRVTLEALRFEAGADTRALDEILKRQEVADGLVNHELKQVELQQERAQLEQTMRELEGLGVSWRPQTEVDKKTVLALNRGALAMRVLGTELREYTPSDEVLVFVDQLRAGGDNPVSQVWNNLTKRSLYRTLSSEDRRFLMHALSISDMDLRPVSGAALNASEVAGSILRLMAMPGDDEGLRNEKLQARADVWKGLAGTLPAEAQSGYPEMPEEALITDAELEAIANGR